MHKLLKCFCFLLTCGTLNTYGQTFTLKTIPLAHPANGDIALLSTDYLLASGHSTTERWLSLVDLEKFTPQLLSIPADAQFFSTATLAGFEREQLVFLTTHGVSHYSFADNKIKPLVNNTSIYPVVDSKRLRHLAISVDVNGSGLSDFLIADFRAYHLWLQQKNGEFIHYPLAIDAIAETYEDTPRYTARTPYLADINLDGKTDIAFVRDGKLITFLQDADGSFPQQPVVRIPGMSISTDNETSLRPGDGRDFGGLVINRFHDFTDLDGDGFADVIIRREVFADALEQNYDYMIHYGHAGEEGLVFNKKADATINTHGIQFESVFADINGDGRKDFYTPTVQFGLGMMVRALISGNAGMEVQFYLMKDDRSFSSKPDHTHKTVATISISGGRVDLPLFQLATMNGSRNKALIVGEKQQRLIVHPSHDDELFRKDRTMFNVSLPRDGSKARIMDINGNGKDDLVLPFDAQDKKENRNQLHLLLMQ